MNYFLPNFVVQCILKIFYTVFSFLPSQNIVSFYGNEQLACILLLLCQKFVFVPLFALSKLILCMIPLALYINVNDIVLISTTKFDNMSFNAIRIIFEPTLDKYDTEK